MPFGDNYPQHQETADIFSLLEKPQEVLVPYNPSQHYQR